MAWYDADELATITAKAVAMAVVVAGAWTGIRNYFRRDRIDALTIAKEEIDTLKSAVATLREEVSQLRTDMGAKDATILELVTERDFLKQLITGEKIGPAMEKRFDDLTHQLEKAVLELRREPR